MFTGIYPVNLQYLKISWLKKTHTAYSVHIRLRYIWLNGSGCAMLWDSWSDRLDWWLTSHRLEESHFNFTAVIWPPLCPRAQGQSPYCLHHPRSAKPHAPLRDAGLSLCLKFMATDGHRWHIQLGVIFVLPAKTQSEVTHICGLTSLVVTHLPHSEGDWQQHCWRALLNPNLFCVCVYISVCVPFYHQCPGMACEVHNNVCLNSLVLRGGQY